MRSIWSHINRGKAIRHRHHLCLISTFMHWTISIIIIIWRTIRIIRCASLTAFSLLCSSSINALMHLTRSSSSNPFRSITVSRITRRQRLIVIMSGVMGTASSSHVMLNCLQLGPVVYSLDLDGWGQGYLSHFSSRNVLRTVYDSICQLLLVRRWGWSYTRWIA